jgi:hypothetical protein
MPLASLYREIGLAAVASGLKLQLNTLDPDVAEAVQRGAAALFLAGFLASPNTSWEAGQTGRVNPVGKVVGDSKFEAEGKANKSWQGRRENAECH